MPHPMVIIFAFFVLLALVMILYVYHIYPKKALRKVVDEVTQIMGQNSVEYRLELIKNKVCDFQLETQDALIIFKVVTLSGGTEIQINNKTMWQLNQGMTLGKAPQSQKMLSGIASFMNAEFMADKPIQKMVIVYPNAHNILMYINECEMVFVNPNTNVHGVKVIRYKELAPVLTSMNHV